MRALVVVSCGLSGCGSWALEHRFVVHDLSGPSGHGIFPD